VVDGHFSLEQAKLWLDKIRQKSDIICGVTFVPDADVYNAALSLLPNKSNADSSENPFSKSWLKYGYRYDGGFKGVKCSNTEALDIANWLLYAEENGAIPNVSMYEAVIQAWTDTGTKEGLLMAEEWAKRAISSSSQTRLDTFHPIIASWALCRLERAPDRVQEWNNQLSAISETKPQLKPSLDTLSAQITAWKNVQAGIMAKLSQTEQPPSEKTMISNSEVRRDAGMIFSAAKNCKQFLEEIYANGSRLDDSSNIATDAMAFTNMFSDTIEAWGCASRFALLLPTNCSESLDPSQCVDEMLNIGRLFDDKINADVAEENTHHILRVVGRSYSEIASQMHQIDSILDPEEATTYVGRKIIDIEKMLRDYDLYSRKHFAQSSSFANENKSVRHRFYKEVLHGCTGVKSLKDHDHVVNACNLIMDHLSWQDGQCQRGGGGSREVEDVTEIYTTIAQLMGTAVTCPDERMDSLTSVYNNARTFFEKRKKFNASSYATVDRARLLGAMRMAMDEYESTERFIDSFDKPRGRKGFERNSALTFVETMRKKKR